MTGASYVRQLLALAAVAVLLHIAPAPATPSFPSAADARGKPKVNDAKPSPISDAPAPHPKAGTEFKSAPAAPTLSVTGPLTVEVGRKCILAAETDAKKVTWKIPAGCDAVPLDGKRLAVWANPGTYVFLAQVPSGDDVLSTEVILTVTGPRPPPVPPGPTPNPPGPTPPAPVPPGPNPQPPAPVTSFRVIFVADDVRPLTREEKAVFYAKSVDEYLSAKTTRDGQVVGWRIYTNTVNAEGEAPAIKALWTAVKPKLTRLPCVVVEVNGNAEIIALDRDDGKGGRVTLTPEEMIAVFRKYRGERRGGSAVRRRRGAVRVACRVAWSGAGTL